MFNFTNNFFTKISDLAASPTRIMKVADSLLNLVTRQEDVLAYACWAECQSCQSGGTCNDPTPYVRQCRTCCAGVCGLWRQSTCLSLAQCQNCTQCP